MNSNSTSTVLEYSFPKSGEMHERLGIRYPGGKKGHTVKLIGDKLYVNGELFKKPTSSTR